MLKNRNDLAKFPHIEQLAHRTYRRKRQGSLGQHRNNGIEICYIHKGRFEWTIEGSPVTALPGTTSVTLPWQVHGGQMSAMDIGMLSWIVLRPEHFEVSGRLKTGHWSSLKQPELDYIAHQLNKASGTNNPFKHKPSNYFFQQIFTEFNAKPPGWIWRVNHLLDDLLVGLARTIESTGQERQPHDFDITWLTEAIYRDPARKWTLDELCQLSGWSKSSLNPRIKAVSGHSTMEHVMFLRLEMAKQKLKESEWPITDIAYELGFSSSQHLSMAFRKRTGLSPSEYRQGSSPGPLNLFCRSG